MPAPITPIKRSPVPIWLILNLWGLGLREEDAIQPRMTFWQAREEAMTCYVAWLSGWMAALALSLTLQPQTVPQAMKSEGSCYQDLAGLPGHYEYGLCTVNQAVEFDPAAQDPYNRLMQIGVEAAADLGDYDFAIRQFEQAIAIRDTPDARRALKAALLAKDAQQHPAKYRHYYNPGNAPDYSVWVGVTGLRSRHD